MKWTFTRTRSNDIFFPDNNLIEFFFRIGHLTFIELQSSHFIFCEFFSCRHTSTGLAFSSTISNDLRRRSLADYSRPLQSTQLSSLEWTGWSETFKNVPDPGSVALFSTNLHSLSPYVLLSKTIFWGIDVHERAAFFAVSQSVAELIIWNCSFCWRQSLAQCDLHRRDQFVTLHFATPLEGSWGSGRISAANSLRLTRTRSMVYVGATLGKCNARTVIRCLPSFFCRYFC